MDTLIKNEIAIIALEHLAELVFVFDERGVILYVNSSGASYFGVKAKEFIGRNLRDFLHSDQADAELEAIRRVIDNAKSLQYENSWSIKGNNFYFSTHKQTIGDKKSGTVAVLSISTVIIL